MDLRFRMDSQHVSIETLHHRIRGEYLEMPGLRLTLAQAVRLWGLDPPTCRRLLQTLIETGFLVQTPEGAFVRSESWIREYPSRSNGGEAAVQVSAGHARRSGVR